MSEFPRCRARPNGVSWAGLGWWLGWWLGWVGLSVAGLISIYNYKSVIAFRGSQLVVLLGFLRAGGVELGGVGAGGRAFYPRGCFRLALSFLGAVNSTQLLLDLTH